MGDFSPDQSSHPASFLSRHPSDTLPIVHIAGILSLETSAVDDRKNIGKPCHKFRNKPNHIVNKWRITQSYTNQDNQILVKKENHRQQRYIRGIRLGPLFQKVEKDGPTLAVQAGSQLLPYLVRLGNLLRCNA